MEHYGYTPVKLPNELLGEVDDYVDSSNLFTSRAGFIRYVIQNYLDQNNKGNGGKNAVNSMGSTK